ncbi:hypothetical protein [Beggiatoa leptomitoformis]|uniref:Transcriptional regulator n=1 Tax=Beggiatoa leptomitoformis TaxID=288004 RepID=A0A2N9YBM5_9GAMM|nr:hypothetical protein [Beggiatoa leptomitoformis]ALG66775.1 hypothetical protein AL038_02420 [Beggiatoa leptomitoformis]AUI67880.1 hypothetical protein BLE401_03625 [Beggiatoa leptomitoformis]
MNKESMLEQLRDEFGTIQEAAEYFHTSRVLLYQSIDGKGARAVRVALAKYFNAYPSDIWQDGTDTRVLDDYQMTETRQ